MRTILTAILVDPFASSLHTEEEEIANLIEDYTRVLKPAKLDFYQIHHMGEVKPKTDLILFDYGGMSIGNDMMEHQSRDVVRWAKDNPSSLVMVVSLFTYDHAVRHLIESELGLQAPHSYAVEYEGGVQEVHNIAVQVISDEKHYGIPDWFYTWATESKQKKLLQNMTFAEAYGSGAATEKLLPGHKFFIPTASFITNMVKLFKGKNIFDVGAGCGHVAQSLEKTKKFKNVAALDLLGREDQEFPVYKCDARSFPYPEDSVMIFCRPCHGRFVEDTIRQAQTRKAFAVVYAGLSKNKASDLGRYSRKFTLVGEHVGMDDENLWVWRIK